MEELRRSFPFSDDLQELEASLSMKLDDVMGDYRPAPPPTHPSWERENSAWENVLPQPGLGDEARWDEMADGIAKAAAEQVIAHLAEVQNPLQAEIEQVRQEADELYKDNKAMAAQIQQMLGEREQMLRAISAYELELTRYRSLVGNLYLRY